MVKEKRKVKEKGKRSSDKYTPSKEYTDIMAAIKRIRKLFL
tara:strand:+ start:1988 stop:2110 length:123 start_codon:yes stop_codon:yes gene_type:complete